MQILFINDQARDNTDVWYGNAQHIVNRSSEQALVLQQQCLGILCVYII